MKNKETDNEKIDVTDKKVKMTKGSVTVFRSGKDIAKCEKDGWVIVEG